MTSLVTSLLTVDPAGSRDLQGRLRVAGAQNAAYLLVRPSVYKPNGGEAALLRASSAPGGGETAKDLFEKIITCSSPVRRLRNLHAERWSTVRKSLEETVQLALQRLVLHHRNSFARREMHLEMSS